MLFMLCRLYVIHRCKKLKQLDFRKVKQKEREEAARVIGETQQPIAAGADKPNTFEPDEELAQAEAATAAAQQQVLLQMLHICPCSTLLGITSLAAQNCCKHCTRSTE